MLLESIGIVCCGIGMVVVTVCFCIIISIFTYNVLLDFKDENFGD